MRLPTHFISGTAAVALVSLLGCAGTENPATPGGGTGPPPDDTSAPKRITDAAVSYDEADGTALLQWTAPNDDEASERVDRYEIRFVSTRGNMPPNFWSFASIAAAPPEPASPGTPQSYLFSEPARGRNLWVGIRSYDEADNLSPPSDVLLVDVPGFELQGRCVDAMTGAPIEGLRVSIASGTVTDVLTDPNGEFYAEDLLPGALGITVTSAPTTAVYHRVSSGMTLDDDVDRTFVMIPYQATTHPSLRGMPLLELFKIIALPRLNAPTFFKWHDLPVPCYFPPYVNDYGIDYAAEARSAATHWMTRTGIGLFEFVSEPPDTGVVVVPRPRGAMGTHIAVTKHTNCEDGHPLRSDIEIRDDLDDRDVTYRVLMHELGHTIRLLHLNYSSDFIMFGGHPLPDDIHEDEVSVVRLHAALPKRLEVKVYGDQP